jgi:glycosyltransferase involved in cell wall biosynthesis
MSSVLLLGPDLRAVSGVSTHLNQLIGSTIALHRRLLHFQVGSEGRTESAAQKASRFLVSPFQLLVRLLRDRPEIVHVNSAMVPKAIWRDIVYVAIARAAKSKIVFQIHGGLLPEDFAAGSRFKRRMIEWTLRSADAVVLLAESERAAYREFLQEANVCVIANAIEAHTLLDSPRLLSHEDRPLRLAYVGRYVAEKGIYDIVDAIALLRERDVAVEMRFAGSGPEERQLSARVTALGLDECIRFEGAVFGAEKDRLWLEADVFPFPTYHCEGLPYSLLESLAAGAVPIICPVAAIPDVMTDGCQGIFVPPRDPSALADSIERLHKDRGLLRSMSAAGRARVRSTRPRGSPLTSTFYTATYSLCVASLVSSLPIRPSR